MCSVEFASRGFISPLRGLGFLVVIDPGAMPLAISSHAFSVKRDRNVLIDGDQNLVDTGGGFQ